MTKYFKMEENMYVYVWTKIKESKRICEAVLALKKTYLTFSDRCFKHITFYCQKESILTISAGMRCF